ncbi:emp24p/erv25p- protein [Loxospora ochrophaea]|nr:emp24p/erv25p- protein [Loxospora ochrophaea]
MERLHLRLPWLRRLFHFALLLSVAVPTEALYFYMDGSTTKCFYEELPKDTLVVGSYKAELYDAAINAFTQHPDLSVSITVDETFDNDHRVVNQRASSGGRFTFSAADSGDHKICFAPSHATSQGWLNSGQPNGGIKLTLDLAIGETSAIESTDKAQIQDIVQKVKDLNGRLQDIRREQVFQRVGQAAMGQEATRH